MTMHDLLGSAAPAFDQPLEMLRACHGRITAQCATLRRLQAHLRTHGNDEQAVQAARAILRYFDTAGQHHHQDEEQDLFPALLASGDGEAKTQVARLLDEHKVMDAAWRALRPRLCAIAEDRANTLEDAVVSPFIDAYARHIEFENGQLLPRAATLLDATQLQAIGRSMATRRGVGA